MTESLHRCVRCSTPIPGINLEFGGGTHVYNLDGDLYCTQACQNGVQADMTRDFAPGGKLSTADRCSDYLRSGDKYKYDY